MPNSCRLQATILSATLISIQGVATEELITTIMPRYSICCSPNFLGPSPKTLGN